MGPVFEQVTSPLVHSDDARLFVRRERGTEPIGWLVIDTADNHVELFTMRGEIADAFVAGYDYAQRVRCAAEMRA